MSDRADITIVGAGVVGLAIAAQVARKDRQVYVLEKNETFGQETSSRHSGVIHAGIYYTQGWLKARMCVEGNRLLYEIGEKYGIGHKRLGKLIVASCQEEISELEALLKNGERNGIKGLRLLSRQEIKKLEPNVEGIAAIFSPTTGIIDSHALMLNFLNLAIEQGAQIAYKSKVVDIEKTLDGYSVTVEDASGRFSFPTTILINCAGLYCDQVAALAGIDITRAGYKLHYCKGEYFSVGHGKNKLAKRLIYPLPLPKLTGVGIHITPDLEGRMRLGPDARYVDSADYSIDDRNKQLFYDSASKLLPALEYDDLEPEMAGIRPKLQEPGGNDRDFVIRDESDKGLPGLINLIGIESPGMTSSPAIARLVAALVADRLGK